ncbi:amino acid ABC transporter permease [Leucobacter sp.]
MTLVDPSTATTRMAASDPEFVARRHGGRWVAAILVACIVAYFAWGILAAPAMRWEVVGAYLFESSVLEGVRNTIVMTILSTLIGVVIGTLVAVMRLSPNPVLWSIAGGYQWFFRGTPTLVQLIFWFNLSSIIPRIDIPLLGIDLDTNQVMSPLLASLLGLGLNFGAYYSEIVRAGILSVDEGQSDAAQAFGLTRLQTMTKIVLPQAMRVIIPPTGNELIGMLKWTSLASVVSFNELLRNVGDIYNQTYQVIPMLIVASLWYLLLTTILSIGQYFVERHFARGTTRTVRQNLFERIIARSRAGRAATGRAEATAGKGGAR